MSKIVEQPDARWRDAGTGPAERLSLAEQDLKDCPFWSNSICQVFAEHRDGIAHTCIYFDSWNREAAQRIIQERQEQGYRQW